MNVLVIAPHADDEILGVGGTILKHISKNDDVYVCIVTRPEEPLYRKSQFDVIRSETLHAHQFLGIKKTFFAEFPTVMLETVPRHEFNAKMLEMINEVEPVVIYIPHFGDLQKDHGIVADAAMVAVRPKNNGNIKRVYAYETLSETEWSIPHSGYAFIPNVFNDISGFLDRKVQAMNCYKSQMGLFPNPRSAEAIEALARYRGSTIHTEAAEAFMLIREIQ